jgi:hypothetical protein
MSRGKMILITIGLHILALTLLFTGLMTLVMSVHLWDIHEVIVGVAWIGQWLAAVVLEMYCFKIRKKAAEARNREQRAFGKRSP